MSLTNNSCPITGTHNVFRKLHAEFLYQFCIVLSLCILHFFWWLIPRPIVSWLYCRPIDSWRIEHRFFGDPSLCPQWALQAVFPVLDFCLTVHHQLGKVIQKNQLDATMIYWSIRSAQHVSGNLLPIIKSVRLRFFTAYGIQQLHRLPQTPLY